MPKNKKISGFLLFVEEWKKRNAPNLNFRCCIKEAGKIWDQLKADERQPYHEKAQRLLGTNAQPRHDCFGKLVDMPTNNPEHNAKKEIDDIIFDIYEDGSLESANFYFIMINYFPKPSTEKLYVPAEISIAEFSLQEGVNRVYHSLVNPACVTFNLYYQAQKHSDDTHKLPLPPNALGETNFNKIYLDLVKFLDITNGMLSLYTRSDSIEMIRYVLQIMKHPEEPDFKIYPIEHLFYRLKDTACKINSNKQPVDIHITNAEFSRDCFEYHSGIGCDYHEKIDCTQFCTQSYVTRWGYMFGNYICQDFAIIPVIGRHIPDRSNFSVTVIEPENECETQQIIEHGNDIDYTPTTSKTFYENNKNSKATMEKTFQNDFNRNRKQNVQNNNANVNKLMPYWNVSSNQRQNNFDRQHINNDNRCPTPPTPPAPINLDFGYCNSIDTKIHERSVRETAQNYMPNDEHHLARTRNRGNDPTIGSQRSTDRNEMQLRERCVSPRLSVKQRITNTISNTFCELTEQTNLAGCQQNYRMQPAKIPDLMSLKIVPPIEILQKKRSMPNNNWQQFSPRHTSQSDNIISRNNSRFSQQTNRGQLPARHYDDDDDDNATRNQYLSSGPNVHDQLLESNTRHSLYNGSPDLELSEYDLRRRSLEREMRSPSRDAYYPMHRLSPELNLDMHSPIHEAQFRSPIRDLRYRSRSPRRRSWSPDCNTRLRSRSPIYDAHLRSPVHNLRMQSPIRNPSQLHLCTSPTRGVHMSPAEHSPQIHFPVRSSRLDSPFDERHFNSPIRSAHQRDELLLSPVRDAHFRSQLRDPRLRSRIHEQRLRSPLRSPIRERCFPSPSHNPRMRSPVRNAIYDNSNIVHSNQTCHSLLSSSNDAQDINGREGFLLNRRSVYYNRNKNF